MATKVSTNGLNPAETKSPWEDKLKRPDNRPVLALPKIEGTDEIDFGRVRKLANTKYPAYSPTARLFPPSANCANCFSDGLLAAGLLCDCVLDQIALENMRKDLARGQ